MQARLDALDAQLHDADRDRAGPSAMQLAEIDRRLQTMRATHPATGRRVALERDLTRASCGKREG